MQQETRQTIIDMFNLGSLDPERQEEMVLKLGELVFEAALARALSGMEEADRIALEAKIDDKLSPEAFLAMVNEKVPNFQEILSEELTELKKQADTIKA
jgi:hypothetical protein